MCTADVFAKLCRLCSLEVEYGFDIFVESEVKASLVILINKYLPIKVTEDDTLPKQICESCHIGVAATVDLIDRMVEGQHQLRKLHKVYLKEVTALKSVKKRENFNSYLANEKEESLNEKGSIAVIDRNMDDTVSESSLFHGETLSQNINLKYNFGKEPKLDDNILLEENEVTQKQSNIVGKNEVIPHTLINIQGNSPDIEMDDLAKGTEVKKVYESHPLGLVVEGKEPKRKRGRPRKGIQQHFLKPIFKKEVLGSDERPKRRTNLPTRFRDSLAGKEFDKLLGSEVSFKDLNKSDESLLLPSLNEDSLLPFSDLNFLNSKEKTHTLDGNTIIITPNHQDEAFSKLPVAINIELDFNDTNFLSGEIDDDGVPRSIHTPKASVSSIHEADLARMRSASRDALSDSALSLDKMLKPRRRRKGPPKKFKFFCEFCNKGFLQIGRYLFHMKLHKNVVLQCDECKTRFSSNEDINLHHQMSNHKGIGVIELENEENFSLKCPLCPDRTFLTLNRYKAHVANMHEGQKPFVCMICNKRFAYKHSLKTHYISHQPTEEKKRYPCKDCSKVFTHQSSLMYHNSTCHNTDRKFVCVFCGCSFKHKQLLQRHSLVHSENRPYSCKPCGKSFKTRGNLYNHMNIHNKTKRYTCEICSKKFGHMTSLNLHLRSHTGEKPFGCTFCGKHFSQNGNLQEHVRIHTGVKPYCCSICGKKFTTSSQLSLHEKRHKGEYRFKCSVCSKGFFNIDSLLIHERKHKGERSYKCKLCPQTLPDKAQLTKHLKSHPATEAKDEKNLKCAVCLKSFPDAFVLAKHVEGHQMEKAWFIAQPSIADESALPTPNQDIIYVLTKKEEEPNLGFISFEADGMFDAEGGEQARQDLPSSATVIPNNYILSNAEAPVTSAQDSKVIYPVQSEVEVGSSNFEITLKVSDPLSFDIPVAEDSSLYKNQDKVDFL